MWTYTTDSMDFVTVSTGLILPYWMGLPIRYIQQPTVVLSKHYKDSLEQPVEVLVNDQVKKQFLSIMFKQMKALKEEEPILFNETFLP